MHNQFGSGKSDLDVLVVASKPARVSCGRQGFALRSLLSTWQLAEHADHPCYSKLARLRRESSSAGVLAQGRGPGRPDEAPAA